MGIRTGKLLKGSWGTDVQTFRAYGMKEKRVADRILEVNRLTHDDADVAFNITRINFGLNTTIFIVLSRNLWGRSPTMTSQSSESESESSVPPLNESCW